MAYEDLHCPECQYLLGPLQVVSRQIVCPRCTAVVELPSSCSSSCLSCHQRVEAKNSSGQSQEGCCSSSEISKTSVGAHSRLNETRRMGLKALLQRFFHV